jgi:hypothetical protein
MLMATSVQEAQEFGVAFPLYIEQSKAWVSKVTKSTITSIAQVGVHETR